MMKIKLLLSLLLLFVGVSMQAQSISAEQMDERFNDGTKMPYGWFAEGWKVEDGKAKSKAVQESKTTVCPVWVRAVTLAKAQVCPAWAVCLAATVSGPIC